MTTPAEALPPTNYRFADLALDAARRSVTRQGQAIELKALDFDLLRFLVEQAPNVVNADVLAEKVWGRHFVSPENVAQRVMLLRQSLADDASRPRYIETIRNKGYRLIPVVERVAAAAARTPRQTHRWLVPSVAALLLAVGTTASRYWVAAPVTPNPNSVAVLPFENLSPNSADTYLAVAMQYELADQLRKIGGLRVLPVRPGKDGPRDSSDLARGLNVTSVLYGSVSQEEGRVGVVSRLTDTAGVLLWSQRYELEPNEIFGVQADIALEVARRLHLEPSAAERENVRRVPTTNQRAHDKYVSALARACCSDDKRGANADIEQALALDGAFKEAWVLKAHIRLDLAAFEPDQADEHNRLGEEAARRALELDPKFGPAHNALGQALLTRNEWRGAEAAFRMARSLNVPPAGMGSYAFLQLSAGKFGTDARDIFEEAHAANPRSALYYRFLMFVREGLGERDRATDLYEDAVDIFSADSRDILLMQNQRMHWLLGRKELAEARAVPMADPFNLQLLRHVDVPDEAFAELRRALKGSGSPEYPNRYTDIGLWAGYLGDPALAFEAMRKSADAGGGRMVYMWMPQLAAMRRLPEFKAYLREVGMVAYWDEFGWPSFCWRLDAPDFECGVRPSP